MSMAELLELLSLYDDATGGWLLVKNENRGGRVGSMYPYAFDEFSVEPAAAGCTGGSACRRSTATRR
jgi:hypothetical protein